MTVITKPITDKKTEKLDQPLVIAECLPNRDEEAGVTDSLPTQDVGVCVLRVRARRASSVTTACLLVMALLVMCCGILGGFYVYKQFAYSQMHRLHGWCRIPYENMNDQMYGDDYAKPFAESLPKPDAHYINEEFDISGDVDGYEKITVPNSDGGHSSRYIHDFNVNKTGIIDIEARRCFVMPLNRTQVLPPKDLIDLVRKMWQGYYEVDTETVRESMRVVLPPISETRSVGMYIQRECAGYPIYKLEKIVSGVFKRSVSAEPNVFTVFSGKGVQQLAIFNLEELKAYEKEHSLT